MPEYRTDIYSKIELLLGLKLFDADQVFEGQKKEYRHFLKKETASADDSEKLLAWYSRFMPERVKEISRKITGYIRLTSTVVIILSFVTGVSAAGVLFYYDGSAPINVLPILAIFVLLPFTLLLVSLIFPLVSRTGTNFLSPFLRLIENRIKKRYKANGSGEAIYNLNELQLDYLEPVQFLFKKTLQKAAAAYVTGALLWMIFNVTTTDLAFSWSSTLELEGETIYDITQVMSAPWARLVPAATVDLETVNSTRFFRAGSADVLSRSSGQWWFFIFMSIIFYSLVPRALVFIYYRRRFKKSLGASLEGSETGRAILALTEESMLIETTAETNYPANGYPEPEPETPSGKTKQVAVLLWYLSDLDEQTLAAKLNRNVITVHKISGLESPQKDKQTAERIAKDALDHNGADIMVFVKCWESPNLRLEKNLKEMIRMNGKSIIRIIPLFEEENQCNAANQKNWGSRMAVINTEIGKKRIFVEFSRAIDIKTLV